MSLDIVVGFFESGKTTFIKKLIQNEAKEIYDNILLINCEYGFEDYDSLDNDINFNKVDILNEDEFNQENINKYIEKYNPDYVLIEYNGVWDISKAVGIDYTNNFNLRNIISTIDYKTMDNYVANMESIMLDKISNSDVIVITKDENFDEHEMDIKYKMLKSINKGCKVFLSQELFLDDENDILTSSITRSDMELIKFGVLFVFFNVFILGTKFLFSEFYDTSFQKVIGIFLSLLVQILPFLLIGSIISSLIQLFMPKYRFNQIFIKTDIKSIFMSLFAGIFFPVCDCAMVPIATSIVKKGYSIPVAMTFLLAAPAVNPIVVLSTYYAFPNNPKLVLYRILFGILIAFLTGIILMIVEKKGKFEVVKEHIDKYSITESSNEKFYFDNKLRYIEAIVSHTKKELFKMGYYVVIGAFISACLQVFVPKNIFIQMNNVNALAVIGMIIAAFFISVCSTSNAFIARSFYKIMPANSILAFMVMGPILDITNLSVMMGTFKKKFIVRLIAILVYISFMIFALLGGGFKVV